jgi:hypothetical protein
MTRSCSMMLASLLLAGSARAVELPSAAFLADRPTDRTDVRGSLEKLMRAPRRAPPPPLKVRRPDGRLRAVSVVPAIEVVDGTCVTGNCPTELSQQYGGVDIYDVDTIAAASRFFQAHPDEAREGYDEVVFFTTFVTTQAGGAYYLPLSNEVRGIARTYLGESRELPSELYNFNAQAGTGSAGFLKGTVLMSDWHTCRSARYLGIPCENKPPYGGSQQSVMGILGQEVGHRWGTFFYFMDGGRKSEELLGRDKSHWSYYADTGGSPMEGNRWADAPGGGWRLEPIDEVRYSPLDLYAMGALPPEEVPPTRLMRSVQPSPCTTDKLNPNVYMRCTTNASSPPAEGTETLSGVVREVTIDEVVGAEGARKPAFEQAQRIVHLAFALIERDDAPASAAEQRTLDGLRRAFTRAFYDGTDRRLRAVTTVSRGDDLGVFDFKLGTEGWDVTPGGALYRDGTVVFPLAGPTTATHPKLEWDAAREQVVTIDLTASRLADVTLRLKWSTETTGDWKTLDLPVPATAMQRQLQVPMTGRPGWTGTLRRLAVEVVPNDAPGGGEVVVDKVEAFANASAPDADADFVPDALDNCQNAANTNQFDTDGDGAGDACDAAEDTGAGGDTGGCGCHGTMLPGAFALAALLARRRR